MKREQTVAVLRRFPFTQVVREAGVTRAEVSRYMRGETMNHRIEVRIEDYARKAKRSLPSAVGYEPMRRDQVVAELRRHTVKHVALTSGVSHGTVYKYLDGKTVHPHNEARLEDYARESKRSSPSALRDKPIRREQAVAVLRRRPLAQVVQESGVSRASVFRYMRGESVSTYIEARLENYARKVAK